MSEKKAALENKVGYGSGEQHLGKKDNSSESELGPQAGAHGQPSSHIAGQKGPEILGGSSSARILGQSVDEQLHSQLPSKSDQK